MTIAKKYPALFALSVIFASRALANPCGGRGTFVFFVNGIYNTETKARDSLVALKNLTHVRLAHIPNLQYDLAWVEGRGKLVQLAQVASQRGLDDFQRFWLWNSGAEKAPDWFDEIVKKTLLDPMWLDGSTLPGIKGHLEKYSQAILDGYEVILVSHSSGNFYANAALRLLPEYISESLQSSLMGRRAENPYYPKPEEMTSNVQIGTPVAATVNGSPWVSFKDDSVLQPIRGTVGALPGNITASGTNPLDHRGHSLVPSYLRVSESQNRIIEHMRAAHQRMKYPIPYFARAATVEHVTFHRGKPTPHSFFPSFRLGGRDITEAQEVRSTQGDLLSQSSVGCFSLRPGTVTISARTILDEGRMHDFSWKLFVGGADASTGKAITLRARRQTQTWKLGKINVSPGNKKSPLEARIEFFGSPMAH